MKTPRLFWLDIWRVAAASLVFCTHYKPLTGAWHALSDEGHIGVALFFVLSGLVLGMQLWQKAPQTGLPAKRAWWQAFYFRRFAKIYLLHSLFYLISLPFIPDTGLEVFLNLTLAKGAFPQHHFSGLQQSWSLTVELMLYLSLPLWALLRTQKGWLPLTLALVFALLFSGLSWFAALYTVLGRAFAFGLGLELARLLSQPIKSFPYTALFKPGSLVPWAVAAATIVGTMLGLGVLAAHYAVQRPHPASTDTEAFIALAANTVFVPLVFALCIWITRPGVHSSSTKNNTIPWFKRIISLLAQASYAFYLGHLGPAANLVYLIAFHNNLLTFLAFWVLSVGFNQIVENPILRIIRGKAHFS